MYRKDKNRWLKHIDFILLDMICLQASYILAFYIREKGFWLYEAIVYRNMAMMLEIIDVVVIFSYGTVRNVLKRGYYRNFVVTLIHTFYVALLSMMYLFSLQLGVQMSRLVFYYTFAIYFILTYATRELWKKHLRSQMKDGVHAKLLVVTSSDIASSTIANLQTHNYARYSLVGVAFTDTNTTTHEVHGVPVVAKGEEIANYVVQNWVDEVMVIVPTLNENSTNLLNQLFETGVTIHLSLEEVSKIPGTRPFVEKVGDYTVITSSIHYASTIELILKRMVDILGGVVGCILTGIIYLFVAPKIKKESPGPVFYSQVRVGRNGKRFKMYKFRSMYLDADERKAELMKYNKLQDGKFFKLDFDPRVIGNEILPDGTHKTGIGDFIRRTSLDEFPQFYNVLKGDMSIVGTRPPLISETELYEPHHRARLSIKPGITGLWQVSGRSDITDFEEIVRLDREYIENWNCGYDIKILLKTVQVVLNKEGSM